MNEKRRREEAESGDWREEEKKEEYKINNLLCFLQIIRQNRASVTVVSLYNTLYATASSRHGVCMVILLSEQGI